MENSYVSKAAMRDAFQEQDEDKRKFFDLFFPDTPCRDALREKRRKENGRLIHLNDGEMKPLKIFIPRPETI